MTDDARARRHHRRGDPAAVAFVVLDGRSSSGPFMVENLSAGGALLTGETRRLGTATKAAIAVGRSVVVQLRLPTVPHWLHASATIIRQAAPPTCADDTFSFAVGFRALSFDVEDAIQNAVLESLEDRHDDGEPAVIMLVEDARDREALTRALADVRRRSIAVSTALELLRLVDSRELVVDAVLVALSVRHASPFGVLSFLADEFPGVRRVLVSSEGDEPAGGTALSSGVAHALLSKPFARERVADVLVVDTERKEP